MLTISTDSLKGYGLNRIFNFAKEAQYDGIDLAITPHNYDTQNTKYIKSLIDEFNIPVLSIQTPAKANPKKIKSAVTMAKALNTKIIIIQPPKIFDFKYIQWLKTEIPKIRQKENISIAMQNSPSDTFLGIIPEHAMGSTLDLKKFKHASLDTTRIAQKKGDLIRIYKSLRKYIVHIHLSNVKAGKPYYLPTQGILPIESFLTKLKQDNYKGILSIKVNPKTLNVGKDEKVLNELKNQKEFYETYFKNVTLTPDQKE